MLGIKMTSRAGGSFGIHEPLEQHFESQVHVKGGAALNAISKRRRSYGRVRPCLKEAPTVEPSGPIWQPLAVVGGVSSSIHKTDWRGEQ